MNVAPLKPPKMELVKEDYNPIKALQGPHSAHSAHSIKTKYENYTVSYINDDQMATILIKHKDKTIAKLSCSAEFPGNNRRS